MGSELEVYVPGSSFSLGIFCGLYTFILKIMELLTVFSSESNLKNRMD